MVAPWEKTTLVSNVMGLWDYPTEKFDSKDDTVSVDIALSVLIVDPVKYMSSVKNVKEALRPVLRETLRIFIVGQKSDDIKKWEYTIRDIDFNNNLSQLEQECGIKIERLYFKNIRSSKEVEKARSKALIAE